MATKEINWIERDILLGKIPNKYRLIIKNNAINIFIKSLLHISVKKSDLIGVQSWVSGYKKPLYTIEFTLKDDVIISEYTDKIDWMAILKLIENENLF